MNGWSTLQELHCEKFLKLLRLLVKIYKALEQFRIIFEMPFRIIFKGLIVVIK